jgi:hypothetical protein
MKGGLAKAGSSVNFSVRNEIWLKRLQLLDNE